MMARFLVYTSPGRGHLYPTVSLMLELVQRGHDVALRTLGSEVAAMRALGLRAAPIAPAIEAIEHDDWKARSQIGALELELSFAQSRLTTTPPVVCS